MTREHLFLLNFFASRDVFRLKGAARGLVQVNANVSLSQKRATEFY